MAVDFGFISKLAQQTVELQDASEHLLRQIARGELEQDDPSFEVVANALGWSAKRKRDELVRMGNVLRYEQTACSDAEFAKRVEHADAVKSTNKQKRFKLEEKISALRNEIAGLDIAEKDAERSVEQAEISRAKLRELVPSFVKTGVDKELNRLHSKAENKRRLELESEIKAFEGFANRTPIHPNLVVDVVRNRFPEFVSIDQYGRSYVSPQSLETIAELSAEKVPELRAEYEQLDRDLAEEEAVILSGLDHYITKD